MPMLYLFPLLVLVALLSFGVRITEIVTEVKTPEQAFTASAVAAEEKKDDAAPVDVPSGLTENDPAPLPEDDWADPTTLEMEFTETQTKVLQELKERRATLDARESRIVQREALMEVTEQRIEEKIIELDSIRNEINDLLGKQSEEEEARLQSLVKIYEGMKPKDASAIFNNLDMDILLQVVSRMSERRSAPIIATMDVKKAQELTTLLAEQKQLPQLPE
jgi:flagellar motility protein MotE (MotC chaperone)